jgi:hypothetical protein
MARSSLRKHEFGRDRLDELGYIWVWVTAASRQRQTGFPLVPLTVRSAKRAQASTLEGLRRLHQKNWVDARKGEWGHS